MVEEGWFEYWDMGGKHCSVQEVMVVAFAGVKCLSIAHSSSATVFQAKYLKKCAARRGNDWQASLVRQALDSEVSFTIPSPYDTT